MSTYRGIVVAKFFQEITVEAASEEEAESMMEQMFNMDRADCVVEVDDLEELP
jgi:hypothetical protein